MHAMTSSGPVIAPNALAPNIAAMPPLLTIAEVAIHLRCSKAHVSKMIHGLVTGVPRLPAAHLGRRVLVHRESLEKWLSLLDNPPRFR
jgi:excisionase family DNA binding protein